MSSVGVTLCYRQQFFPAELVYLCPTDLLVSSFHHVGVTVYLRCFLVNDACVRVFIFLPGGGDPRRVQPGEGGQGHPHPDMRRKYRSLMMMMMMIGGGSGCRWHSLWLSSCGCCCCVVAGWKRPGFDVALVW